MFQSPFHGLQAGKFISRGKSRHATRTIRDFELIFVLSETLSMFEGSTEYSIKPGQYLLLRPNIRHGGISDYPPKLSFYWLHFTPGDQSATDFLNRMASTGTTPDPARTREYLQLYVTLHAESPVNRTALDLMLQLILHETTRPALPRAQEDRPVAVLAREADRMIQLYFYEPWTISRIAAKLHCNSDHLGRLFKQSYGVTVTEALHARRIKRAGEALRSTASSIKEIAQNVGYEDMAYFRRRFFAVHSMTPHEYRLRHAQGYANTE